MKLLIRHSSSTTSDSTLSPVVVVVVKNLSGRITGGVADGLRGFAFFTSDTQDGPTTGDVGEVGVAIGMGTSIPSKPVISGGDVEGVAFGAGTPKEGSASAQETPCLLCLPGGPR
jgi:hypothetical protein